MFDQDVQDESRTPSAEDNGPKKGEVTIHYFGPTTVVLEPPMGVVDRVVQKMTWKFIDHTSTGKQLAVPGGIFFPWPIEPPPTPPPVYSEWVGDVPTGTGIEYTAKVKQQAPGPGKIFYLYFIKIDDGTEEGHIVQKVRPSEASEELIDPPIENEPEP